MTKLLRVSRTLIAKMVALLTLLSPLGCSTSSGATSARTAPTSGIENDTNECASVGGLAALKHVRHLPYSGSLGNDSAVQKLASLWPPNGALADALSGELVRKRSIGTDADADLGFGAVRVSVSASGGHVWCDVTAVLFLDEFASAEARCSWRLSGKQSQCIADRYRKIFAELGMAISQEEAVVRVDYAKVLERMHQARLRALGLAEELPARNTPQDLAAAESYLRDPLNEIRVGSFPGRGSPSHPALAPIGFTATRALVDAKAIDVLRRVLRGPNPGGRGFAAVGLSTLGAASQDDLQVIDKLKTSSPIATQFGCMVTIGSAQEFFNNLTSFHYMFEPQKAMVADEADE